MSLSEQLAQALALRPVDLALAGLVRRLQPLDSDLPAALPELAAALASRQFGQGHVCLPLHEELLPPSCRAAWPAVAEWPALLAASPLVAGGDGQPSSAPFVLAGDRFYLRRCWQQEQAVRAALLQRASLPLQPVPGLAEALQRLFPDAATAAHTDWQQVACALAACSRFSIITGGPGTGKTTTVVKLLALWQEQALAAGRPWRIGLAAPTGKAAARLTDAIAGQLARLDVPDDVRAGIPRQVATLHRLLGSRPDTRRFRHDADHPLVLDVLVIDEASMIDLEMMAAVLAALPANARLVLLGDKDQLASVEAGAVFADLCRDADAGRYDEATLAQLTALCGRPPEHPDLQAGDADRWPLAQRTVMLRHSWRFGDDSGIGRLARAVNRGDAEDSLAVLREADPTLDLHLLSGPRDALRALVLPPDGEGALRTCLEAVRAMPAGSLPPSDSAWPAWAHRVLDAFEGFQLLSPLRDGPWGVSGLNAQVTSWLVQEGWMPEGTDWYPGRPVLVTRNDPVLGLMNGDVGLVLPWPADGGDLRLHVVFRQATAPDGLRRVLPSRLQDIETAFALTVHKSQGSEFGHTVLILPDQDAPVLTRELVYTAVTRARQHFTLAAGSLVVLAQAIRRRTTRASGLQVF